MRGMEAIRYSGAGLFFFGAVLLALLAGVTVYSYLSSAAPSSEVIVVAHDMPPGATLTAADLETRTVAASAVPGEAIRTVKDAVGKRIRYGLAAGDYLRKVHLAPDDAGDVAGKVAAMGEEYRAVMLPGELVPAMDRLLPGDRLELTGVLPVQDGRSNTSVAVPLGVATVMDVKEAKGQTDKATVLVAMRAGEVPKLALTMRVGALTVAVEAAGKDAAPAPSVRLEALTGVSAPPVAPAGAPAGTPGAATPPAPPGR